MQNQSTRPDESDDIDTAILRGNVQSIEDVVVEVGESEIGAARVTVRSGDNLVRLGVDLPVGEAEELRDELVAVLGE